MIPHRKIQKISLYCLTLLSGVSFCSAIEISASTKTVQPPIHFESDSLEYQELNQVIIASGNVKVRQSSYTFYSDHAIFDIPKKNLSAWGLVRFSDVQGNEIRAKSLTYETQEGSAKLLDTEGSFGPWIFAAQKVIRDSEGNFFLERAKLSTCETDFSKYHLYGQRIKIMPKKRLTVQNALFRIGPVPVLYLPYYYYSLGEKHLGFQIFPGRGQSEGAFARTVWGYPTTDETYTQVYLDYLSRRGLGTGGEINYYFGDQAKGSIYGYRIDDQLRQQERWNARFFHWERFGQNLILQSNINQLSDESFPNDFFREDYNRIVRDPKSSVSATYQKGYSFFRLIGDRSELFDVGKSSEFFPSEILAPRFEFSQVQTPVGFLGLQKNISASFTNRFAGRNFNSQDNSRDYRRESEAVVSILRQLRLSRSTTFVPKINFRNLWTDRPQGTEPQDKAWQKLETESTLRQSLSHMLDIDLTYRFTQRLQDNQGDDQGREVHSLSYLSTFQPWYWFYFRLETAHNLPRLKAEPIAFLEPKNYQPIRGEISINPRHNLELFLREEYTLFDPITGSKHPLNTETELTFGHRVAGEDYASIGTSYFASRDNAFELRLKGRYTPFETIKLEGTLRTLLFYSHGDAFEINRADLLEKELLVRQEWRCWELSFVFRERAGVVEFLFNLELKLERLTREKSRKENQGAEWYPWRGLQ